MPRGDGTGPWGTGPMGRGRGGCATFFGNGLGQGIQNGFGFSRWMQVFGNRRGGFWGNTSTTPENLEAQAASLRIWPNRIAKPISDSLLALRYHNTC